MEEGDSHSKEWFLWLLGAALFAHTIAFFGITYFDQMQVAWFALLAMVSAATAPMLEAKAFSPARAADVPSAEMRLA